MKVLQILLFNFLHFTILNWKEAKQGSNGNVLRSSFHMSQRMQTDNVIDGAL